MKGDALLQQERDRSERGDGGNSATFDLVTREGLSPITPDLKNLIFPGLGKK